ncbi:MAG: hypothetical protein JWR21_3456 [Herminiimonas sp.]|nr:hypothetical protein [Herminiimonas sp.]MDB5854089.1 hypothetical protein [Herminiimonas sp.]
MNRNSDDAPAKPPVQAVARIVLVDTNSFLRLYHSPVVPFLGQEAAGYRLLTLATLIDEFRSSPRLMNDYAWVAKAMTGEDLQKAAVKLTAAESALVHAESKFQKQYANRILEAHCLDKNLKIVRSLSGRDVQLLATAIVLGAVIATDEWPLKFVVDDLMSVEGDYDIDVISSLDVLKSLEADGRLSRAERISTVRSWLRFGECLPTKWREIYSQLFGEGAPSL